MQVNVIIIKTTETITQTSVEILSLFFDELELLFN